MSLIYLKGYLFYLEFGKRSNCVIYSSNFIVTFSQNMNDIYLMIFFFPVLLLGSLNVI